MLQRRLSTVCFSKNFGRQMRLITGPRQAGKTTLAYDFLRINHWETLYYNWDKVEVRSAYRANPSFFVSDIQNLKKSPKDLPWVCFDEIHKIPRWKNVLKGIFDSYEQLCRFVITGSARVDLLKYTGESLLGRYFTFRLFPLSLAEICHSHFEFPSKKPLNALAFIESCLSNHPGSHKALEHLLKSGGFPDPFLANSEVFTTKWRQDYLTHYVREDLRDLTQIVDVEHCFHLIELLPSRIGSPLSLNSLREDLEVSHTAVRNWLRALTLIYVLFWVPPYSKKLSRGVKKEQKCYFFDWTQAQTPGAIFENYAATELFSYCAFLTDAGLGNYDLYYVRTKDGKESDFLIVKDKKPWILFECKLEGSEIASHHLLHASHLGDIPVVQLVLKSGVFKVFDKKNFIISADRFFSNFV